MAAGRFPAALPEKSKIMPFPALSPEKGRGPDVYGQSEKRLTNPL
jgi:hypothetical protein